MIDKRYLSWILLIAVLTAVGLDRVLAQEVPLEEPIQEVQVVKEPEKIIPSPKNIKESTAIYIFVGWVWLSIIVLIFILRAKIKEVDRLHRIKFFNEKKE